MEIPIILITVLSLLAVGVIVFGVYDARKFRNQIREANKKPSVQELALLQAAGWKFVYADKNYVLFKLHNNRSFSIYWSPKGWSTRAYDYDGKTHYFKLKTIEDVVEFERLIMFKK